MKTESEYIEQFKKRLLELKPIKMIEKEVVVEEKSETHTLQQEENASILQK